MGDSRKKKAVEKPKKTNRSQFCTIIVSPALQFRKLVKGASLPNVYEFGQEIPSKFVKNHGKHLPNTVYVRVPNGRDWPVQLLKRSGNAWLQRGWSRFVEHYSIAIGNVLVFRYDGRSRFRVVVFDTTALEIKYSHGYTTRVPKLEKTEEGEPVTKNEKYTETKQKCEGESSDEERSKNEISTETQHQCGESSAEEVTMNDTSTETQQQCEGESSDEEVIKNDTSAETQQQCEGESSDEESGEDRVFRRASAFQSPNPFFISPIRKRNLSGNSGPKFPTSHCTKYFKQNDGDNNVVTLRINKSTWDVKYHIEKFSTFCISLASGWKEFVLENHLKEGDVCVYELIHSAKKTYNVHIFRIYDKMDAPAIKEEEIEDDDDSIELTGEPSEGFAEGRVLQRARSFGSENPHFMAHIRKTNLNCNSGPVLPLNHSRTYFKQNDSHVILCTNQKNWPISCHVSMTPQLRISLGIGWKDFTSKNELKEGDICVFELVHVATKTYNVHIFRIEEEEEIEDDAIPAEETSGRRARDVKCANAVEKANAFVGDSPGFVIQMSRSYVDTRTYVRVPIEHGRRYFKDEG